MEVCLTETHAELWELIREVCHEAGKTEEEGMACLTELSNQWLTDLKVFVTINPTLVVKVPPGLIIGLQRRIKERRHRSRSKSGVEAGGNVGEKGMKWSRSQETYYDRQSEREQHGRWDERPLYKPPSGRDRKSKRDSDHCEDKKQETTSVHLSKTDLRASDDSAEARSLARSRRSDDDNRDGTDRRQRDSDGDHGQQEKDRGRHSKKTDGHRNRDERRRDVHQRRDQSPFDNEPRQRRRDEDDSRRLTRQTLTNSDIRQKDDGGPSGKPHFTDETRSSGDSAGRDHRSPRRVERPYPLAQSCASSEQQDKRNLSTERRARRSADREQHSDWALTHRGKFYSSQSEERPADRQEKLIDRQEKLIDRQERPVDRQERPVDRQERPVDRQERPVDRQERPVDRQERPVDRHERPVDRQERPVDRQERPVDTPERSADRHERPVDRHERPERPVDTPERSADRQERPVDTPERSADRQERSADRQERPINGQERSADRHERPVDRQERPINGQKRSADWQYKNLPLQQPPYFDQLPTRNGVSERTAPSPQNHGPIERPVKQQNRSNGYTGGDGSFKSDGTSNWTTFDFMRPTKKAESSSHSTGLNSPVEIIVSDDSEQVGSVTKMQTPIRSPPRHAPMESPPRHAPMQRPPWHAPMESPPWHAPMQRPPWHAPMESPPRHAPMQRPPWRMALSQPQRGAKTKGKMVGTVSCLGCGGVFVPDDRCRVCNPNSDSSGGIEIVMD